MQFFAIEEDITERKNAAEKLRQSEERWKFALESSGEGVWEYNIQTEASFFSSQYEKMLGYSKADLEQESGVWKMLLHPDDYHIIQEYDQSYTQGLIINHQTEYRIKCKDGKYIWVLDRGMLMSKTPDGKPLSIIGTHTDITELKASELLLEKSEKKFRSLSENIPGVVYEFAFRSDGEHGFKFISPTMEKIFGISAEDFFQFSRFVHPDDAMSLMKAINDSAETNLPFYYEGRLKIDGGNDAWYSASGSFSYRENDGTRIYTGILINITERKEIEGQMRFNEKR